MKVAIIGQGFGRSAHLPAWQSDPRATVLGVFTRQDTPAVLARSDVDIVSLAVPPAAQPALIEAAAGKHIFCEKPLAADLASAARLKPGGQFGIDLFFPEIPAWQEARKRLPSLGPLRHAHLSWRLESRAFRFGATGWKTNPAEGGGTLVNFASHTFHYLEWLFGPIASLTGQDSGGHGADVQAGADLLLRFPNGLTATLSVAADAYQGSGHRLEVYGQHGSLVLSNNSGDFARGFRLQVALKDQPWQDCTPPDVEGQGDGRVPLVSRLVSRLLDAIENGHPMRPGLAEALRVQRLLEAARSVLEQRIWMDL
ncbi:MAG: Gfo/Idh/MocA family protein [Vulcanimicrobiota bacterium]